ncbi:MAG: hypothetical protein WAN60_06270 [Candidatus Sulfotelmatobacter sp.]
MATSGKPPAKSGPVHNYYAEANVLSADLKQPLKEKIPPRVQVKLPANGRYQFKKASAFRFQGIISYQSAYSQVAGHPSSKSDGFATLATAVVEGLNVLDVVTADRVVAQISTVHPVFGTGQVPSVTFLGTRFENLRIGGHKVEVERALDILGPKPAGDKSYFDDPGVQSRISLQYDKIATAEGHPELAAAAYPKGRAGVIGSGELQCSLVSGVTGAPGTSFGHVIDVPHFGKIFLAELRVTREPSKNPKSEADKYRFYLTMIRLEMGCLAQGSASVTALDSNGGGKGTPPPTP